MEDEFERLFQQWIVEGGLDSTSCLREDLEREARSKSMAFIREEMCKHGNRPLQCAKCYFGE